jgi:alpha-tubulin suppressor-like RCC1 family protein
MSGPRRQLRVALAVAAAAGAVVTGASARPEAPAPPTVVQIATGFRHTCAITSAGRVMCWGSNAFGQLGDRTRTTRRRPVEVVGLRGARAITAGSGHTCALTSAGAVKCWGNVHGVEREPRPGDRASSTPVAIFGLTGGVATIAAAGRGTCALLTTGAVRCWGGYNSQGRIVAAEVSGLPAGLTAISGGGSGYCGITGTGGVVCWESVGRPAVVAGLSSGISSVTIGTAPGFGSAGNSHICALSVAGGVKCWGSNMFGELGDGGSTNSAVPVDVSGLTTGIVAIDAGNSYTCALTSAGGVKCWGGNSLGQLGNGRKTAQSTTPVDVVFTRR